MTHRLCLGLALLVSFGSHASAGENAAPSSHLVFDDNFRGDILINQVRVPKAGAAMFTYYEALGWRGKAAGYAGIQVHPRAHLYLFSIWDHKSHSAPIRAVYRGAKTKTEKFGGEGTGLKSWNFDLGWQTDVWYTLLLRRWPVEDHTYFAFWTHSDKTKKWTHMVTMDVAVADTHFEGGTDCFIEDWLETGKNARTTHLRNGWKRKPSGQWYPFGTGRYSVNAWDLDKGKRSYNYRTNWNAGVARDSEGSYYYMVAGGAKTKPTTTNPSKFTIPRTDKKPGYRPIRIESVRATRVADRLEVTWTNDASTLPQFGYVVSVFDNPQAKGKPIRSTKAIVPHARKTVIELPSTEGRLFVRLECGDVLDNASAPKVVAVEDGSR